MVFALTAAAEGASSLLVLRSPESTGGPTTWTALLDDAETQVTKGSNHKAVDLLDELLGKLRDGLLGVRRAGGHHGCRGCAGSC